MDKHYPQLRVPLWKWIGSAGFLVLAGIAFVLVNHALAAWFGAPRRNPVKFKEGFLIPGLMAALVILLTTLRRITS